MKKFSLIVMALALVMGLSQCQKKPNAPVFGSGYSQNITVNTNCGDKNSKVTVDDPVTGLLDIKWEVNTDKLNVSGAATGTITCVSSTGSTGEFSGPVNVSSEGNLTFTYGEEPDYSEQDGTLEWIKENFYLVSDDVPFEKTGVYDFDMKTPYAVLKLDLSNLGNENGTDVKITRSVPVDGDGTYFATIKNVKSDAPRVVYIAVPVGKAKYTFSGNIDKNNPEIVDNVDKTWDIKAGTFYSKGGTGEAFVVKHEFVDLGLTSGNLWADCNVGSGAPEESGVYYQWGGTDSVTKTSINLNWINCPYTNGEVLVVDEYTKIFKKYITREAYAAEGYPVDNKIDLELMDDASYLMWGHRGKMANKKDFEELLNECDHQWCDDYKETGVKGVIFTSKANPQKSIFFPAAGSRTGTELSDVGVACRYWSTSLYGHLDNHGLYFYYEKDKTPSAVYNGYRYYGRPLRPIKNGNN
ncbi:MAG: hypothetical protein Q4F69_11865 [Bacteroidia bacterium]|nr:hypothetical protein [Bacteroidia bacterium]